ncbi:VCBS domain-containing protein, partial [Enterovibrio baiacu]|uniref:VCBS domain-containing protein n=1 Tax=Enterovibrio baiacu TaxID=2491023 RepID=UPI0010128583
TSVSGTLSITDVDDGDTPSFDNVSIDGDYGTFTLTDGNWTYTVDPSKADALNDNQTEQEVFTLTASDGTVQQITVDVTGADDAAVITGDSTASITEDTGAQTATGTITITDADTGDTPTIPNGTLAGEYGSLTLVDGAWTYTADSASIQSLADGDTATDTITVTASDGTTQDIVITITGTDDAAVVTGDTTGTTTDQGTSVSGSISISDVDNGENPTISNTTIDGEYGSLTLTDGEWTYTVNSESAQTLPDGESANDTFTLTASDGSTHQITVTVEGTDDAAVVTGDLSASVAEGGDASVSGSINISDPDAAVQPTLENGTVEGEYGSLTLTDGEWTYTVNPDNAQSLGDGDSATDTITVTASDGSEHQITITVTGSDDASVVTGVTTGGIDLGADTPETSVSGTLSITDVDDGDTPSFDNVSIDGDYGTFTLTDGNWTYTVDPSKADALNDNQTEQEVFTLTASDGTVQQITVDVTGADDAAVITGDSTASITEDAGAQTASGTITITDADTGDTPTIPNGTLAGEYGSLTLVDGAWTYTADSASIQSLADGDTATDTITVTASDGTTQDIVITITGTDDAAVIEGNTSGAITEDTGAQTASGTITITDADTGETPTIPNGTLAGEYGSLTLVDGAWTYTADSASIQSLADGDTATDTITVTASDGSTQDIVITITGTDDAAVVEGDTSGTVTEGDIGDVSTATGELNIVDPDGEPVNFPDANVSGEYGSLTLVDGAWTYTLDQDATQSLNQDQEVTDTITVTASDGTTQDITITVTGTDDAAEVSGTFTASVDTDGFSLNASESGNIQAGDATTGDSNGAWTTTTTTIDGVPYVISTSFGYDGTTIISRVEDDGSLTETDRISYDSSTGTVTSTSGGDITDVIENAGVSVGAMGNGLTQSNVSNIDGQDTLFLTSQNSGSLSAWEISSDGTLSLNGGLTFGNSQTGIVRENVTFEADDGTEYVFVARPQGDSIDTLTYNPETGEFAETGNSIAAGDLVSGVDIITVDGQSFLASSSDDGINIYSVDSDTGNLTLVDSQPLDLSDGNSVNFYQTGDGTTYAIASSDGSDNASIFEVGANGSMTLTDTVSGGGAYMSSAGYIDGEPVFVMPNATEGVDLYTINDSGDLVLQTTVTGIENDKTPPVIVQTSDGSYYLVDGDGQSTTVKLDFGNDSDITVSGTLSISDADSDDSPSFENTTVEGEYGTLTLTDGVWTYTVDEAKSQSIGEDQVETDTITLTATDGTQQDISITVTGTDDQPEVSGNFTGNVVDAKEPAVGDNLLINGDFETYGNDSGNQWTRLEGDELTGWQAGEHGVDVVQGTYSYMAPNATDNTIIELDTYANSSLEQTVDVSSITASEGSEFNLSFDYASRNHIDGTSAFQVEVLDQDGNVLFSEFFENNQTSDHYEHFDVNFTVAEGVENLTLSLKAEGNSDGGGANLDNFSLAPIVSIEEQTVTSGTIDITDADDEDSPTFENTTVEGEYGTLTLTDGEWTYVLDSEKAQSLAEGQAATDTITVTASDGTSQDIEISLTGTDDAAVVTGDTSASVTANSSQNITIGNAFVMDQNVDYESGSFVTWSFPPELNFSDSGITVQITDNDGQLNSDDSKNETSEDKTQSITLDGEDYSVNVDYSLSYEDGAGNTYTFAVVDVDMNGDGSNAVSGTESGKVLIQLDGPEITPDTSLSLVPDSYQNISSLDYADIEEAATVSGTLNITDVDAAEAPAFENTTIEGEYGSLTLVDGEWTYTVDTEKAQSLGEDQTATDTITLTATDGTTQNIDITVSGVDEAAVVSGDTTGNISTVNQTTVETSVTRGSEGMWDTNGGDSMTLDFSHVTTSAAYDNSVGYYVLDAEGNVLRAEIIFDDAHSVTSATADINTEGGEKVGLFIIPDGDNKGFNAGEVTLSFGSNGVTAYQGYASGTTLVSESSKNGNGFDYESNSGSSSSWEDIVGGGDRDFNDVTFTVNASQEVSQNITTSGTISISDVDEGQTPTLPNTTVEGEYGSLTLVDGEWTYTLDPELAVAAGEESIDTIVITASDGSQHEIVIAIAGTDDAPEVSGVFTGTVNEGDLGDTVSISGSISITDVDSEDTPEFEDTTITGQYGSLDLVDGVWTYTVDNEKTQELDTGTSVKDTITLTASDGTTQNIEVTVQGTDDAPFVVGTNSAAIVAPEPVSNDFIEVNNGFILNEGYSFDSGDMQYYGNEPTLNFNQAGQTIRIYDEDGTMDGDNYQNEYVQDTSQKVEIGGVMYTATYDYQLDYQDSAGNIYTFAVLDVDLDGDGSFRYDSNEQGKMIIQIGGPEITPGMSMDYLRDTPNQGRTMSYEDIAVDTAAAAASVTGQLSLTDVDAGDSPYFANNTVEGSYGSLELVDGSWTYTLNPDSTSHLQHNDVVTDVITLTASDGVTQTDVNITIGGSETALAVNSHTMTSESMSDVISLEDITFTGSSGDDKIAGSDAHDVLLAQAGDDLILGGGGNDVLDGGLGHDILVGGQGNDTMAGGAGADTFAFLHGDQGTASDPAIDHITDFDTQNDALNLSDLVQTEEAESMESYLSLMDGEDGNATLSISSQGDGNVDQKVVFDNMSVEDMADAYSVDIGGMTSEQISSSVIDAMIAQSKVIID